MDDLFPPDGFKAAVQNLAQCYEANGESDSLMRRHRLAATRLIRSLLFGVAPTSPVTLCMGMLCLFVVAMLAAWIPARRATKVDPMVALRYE